MIPLSEIERAREVIRGRAIRTPLVQLDGGPWLKLENLQPIGAFKLRGALNAMAGADLSAGVVTASAGNMGQGVAWAARDAGIPCTVVVPDTAPKAKLDAMERLGARLVLVSFDVWWQTMEDWAYPGLEGLFVHPSDDDLVMAGNGTIALEILEDLPEPDAVLVPWGGGGLTVGVASALRQLSPQTKVYAVEIDTSAPLRASLAAGEPVRIDHTPSFVDGIGGPGVSPRQFERARELLDGVLTVTLEQTADAIRLLATRAHVVAEGAGAAPVAAAAQVEGAVVCIVSGGNIDAAKLAQILDGRLP